MSDVKCVHWPDEVPARSRVGLVSGRLVYTHPVAKAGMVWYYLADCGCGKEYITRENGGAQSCGCLRGRKVRGSLPLPAPVVHEKYKPFDRNVTCMRVPYKCIYYTECQDDRLYGGKKLSARYSGGGTCYTQSEDERRALEGI